MKAFDVIIAGAGSVGVPTAMALGLKGLRVLVLDAGASPGQGENKAAIGGIRATHSDPAKVRVCLRSLEIFSRWEEQGGENIEWLQGGYLFPVYREQEEHILRELLPIQQAQGLRIDFIPPEEVRRIVPGIKADGLRGGTFSPFDGSASPLRATNAFYRRAKELGVVFRFREPVCKIITRAGRFEALQTHRGTYQAGVLVDAAGARSGALAVLAGTQIPVQPDAHEAGVSEPVAPFFRCMVVDLRAMSGSRNVYFHQIAGGQVVFCLASDPSLPGEDRRATSSFLPRVCRRMVELLPRLQTLRVRRVWCGLYPNSPDGSPLVGWNREVQGLLHATGMCGQGFMLGPGIGELVARLVKGESEEGDEMVLERFCPYRDFQTAERLK